jgi:hypothetical protein
VGIRLTLKICGRLNESDVGPKLSGDGHQESEGVDTQAVCGLVGHVPRPPLPEEHAYGRSNTIMS